ncbi:S9 family peptidase [Fulvivirga kasyanovii]|uniref:S9 family peptidase n=2 Tax=Fulvivirga kasyanovii TaxID=396812 RepID=A0ABW9RQC1_9BACT|nr:S9 family peptidase [Fulvivirga kasyanovii]
MKLLPYYTLALLITCIFTSCEKKEKETMKKALPPKAEKIEKQLVAHGHTRIDNYYWLNNREDQKVIDYLEAENAYTDTLMKHTEGFQEKLYNEIVGRIKQTDESVPYRSNGYWYYTRYEEGQEYPIYCRKKESLDNEEEVMLNVNVMAEGHEYYHVTGLNVSLDNNLLAYGVDTVSRRQYTIYVKNLSTGQLLEMSIDNTTGGSTWANDNKTLFYTKKDPNTLRSNQIYKHRLGAKTDDEMVFEEEDDTFYTGIYKTKSDQYLIIWSGSTLTNDYRILNANEPEGEFRQFSPREKGLEYSIEHYEDKFYVVTNLDAVNFRLMETPVEKTGKENWKEVIAHDPEVYLENIEVFKNHLVVEERSKGLSHLRIIDQKTKQEHYLDFGEEAYTAYISVNPEFNTTLLRYGYTSLTTPNSTFDYNMETRKKTLLKEQEVVGGYNKEEYETKRLYAEARDGVKVPISLVYKKSLRKTEGNPTLLYGYGSYGATMDPSFSSTRLSLLDRGFVFAIAHIRGSQMLGREWYEEGKMFKKKNTFNDFIDCAEYLVKQKYVDEDNLFAMGGSAGGLLMGAVVNLRPDLWKGVVAAVPFVDVMTTMLDESIPLTTGEYDEWGNPNNKDSYEYMLSYSPYDNVKAQSYPNMLVTTGLHDSQVQYWEPAKWVAKLREMKTDDNKLLLKTNMDAGHGGASGRFEKFKEVALDYAFILDLAGVKE